MILCSIHNILSLFLIIVISVHGIDLDLVSNEKIHNITDKIALEIRSQSSSEKIQSFVSNIEKNLQKTAQHSGPIGKKHIKLIMEGIQSKAFNGSKDNSQYLRVVNEKSNSNKENQVVNSKNIYDLAKKVDSLLKHELETLKPTQNKLQLLDEVKKVLLESFNKKQREMLEADKDVDLNNTRRVGLESTNEAELYNDPNKITDEIAERIQNYLGIETDTNFAQEISRSFKSATVSPLCEDVYDRVCLGIKNMNSLKCLNDDTTISLDKLCNDNFDCSDRSDEKYCGSQAMERMQYSNWVMTNIESYLNQNCFKMDNSGTISSRRKQVIQDVLQIQTEFKEKYKNLSFSFQSNNLINKDDSEFEANLKVKANEIALIIRSLALALDDAFCSHRTEEYLTRKSASVIEKDADEMVKKSWPPKNCKCDRGHCSNCTRDCKRICWKQNSLTLWNCESIDGTDTIPLSSLCDGKLDCLDESDERNCVKGNSYEKFEAEVKYGNVLKMLSLKIPKERSSTQKLLMNLRNLIVTLRNLTIKYVTNSLEVKKIRNKCYSLLRAIYLDIVQQSADVKESEEAYLFLLSVNQNLGAALKRSHSGNNKIIADGCYCRKGSCVESFCSKVCVKACAVEPKLMRYRCNRRSNATVSVDDICDDKQNCPDGLDELNCKKDEICRRHHLIVLRNNIQDIGSNYKGTALGELLLSWKTKVMSTIKLAEKTGRPKPKALKNIVKEILRDLLVTYGLVEDYRKSNTGYALPEFVKIAQVIMENLKSCGK